MRTNWYGYVDQLVRTSEPIGTEFPTNWFATITKRYKLIKTQ